MPLNLFVVRELHVNCTDKKRHRQKEAFSQLEFFGRSMDEPERKFIKDYLLQFDKKKFDE